MRSPPSRHYPSDVLTTQECADFLKVHRSSVYRMLARGAIPAFKVGSDWRFHKKQLIEWLERLART